MQHIPRTTLYASSPIPADYHGPLEVALAAQPEPDHWWELGVFTDAPYVMGISAQTRDEAMRLIATAYPQVQWVSVEAYNRKKAAWYQVHLRQRTQEE